MYKFVGKTNRMYSLDFSDNNIKLNYKCEFNGSDFKCDDSNPDDTFHDLMDKLDELGSSNPSIKQISDLRNKFDNLSKSKNIRPEYSKKAKRVVELLNEKTGPTKSIPTKSIPTKSIPTKSIPVVKSDKVNILDNINVSTQTGKNTSEQLKIRTTNIDKFNKNNAKLESTLTKYNKTNPITDKNTISTLKRYAIAADLLDSMESIGKGKHLSDIGDINDFDMNVNYSLMNNYARNIQLGKTSWEKAPVEMKNARSIIYNALEKSKLPQDVTVYRGVNISENKQYVSDIMKIGAENKDPAFRSTSINPAIAETYAFPDNNNKQVIEVIDVPKGTNGRFLDESITATDEEKEVLLQSDLTYKTTDVRSKDGITYVFRKVIR